jgi:inosine-uridine nucleoside N-ribohydrolase
MADKIPVILDTDIGSDIDDTWALALLLRSPEFDIRLIVTDTGDTWYRAQIVARLLEVGGAADIPIGIGIPLETVPRSQLPWVAGYQLARYPGPIYEDGVGALIDTIMRAPEPITLLSIGPVPNIAAALAREPEIARRARFVGMHGSIRRGYAGSEKIAPEYNVKCFPYACQKVFTAPWDMAITPLDTCGLVRLEGEKYRAVLVCQDPLIQAVIENYRIWIEKSEWSKGLNADRGSSVLFDTVAVYLALSEHLLRMEALRVRVTDDGYTLIDDRARVIRCATAWRDLPAFEDWLVQRLTGRASGD